MKSFEYVITDEVGIHARPAGALVKVAKEFECTITVEKAGKAVEATKLMGLMSLGVKKGDTVIVAADGAGEEEALESMRAFFAENL